jgi:hypothetical protein
MHSPSEHVPSPHDLKPGRHTSLMASVRFTLADRPALLLTVYTSVTLPTTAVRALHADSPAVPNLAGPPSVTGAGVCIAPDAVVVLAAWSTHVTLTEAVRSPSLVSLAVTPLSHATLEGESATGGGHAA